MRRPEIPKTGDGQWTLPRWGCLCNTGGKTMRVGVSEGFISHSTSVLHLNSASLNLVIPHQAIFNQSSCVESHKNEAQVSRTSGVFSDLR